MMTELLDRIGWHASRAVCRVLGHRWIYVGKSARVCDRVACRGADDAFQWLGAR